jgi:hypothetical protein
MHFSYVFIQPGDFFVFQFQSLYTSTDLDRHLYFEHIRCTTKAQKHEELFSFENKKRSFSLCLSGNASLLYISALAQLSLLLYSKAGNKADFIL